MLWYIMLGFDDGWDIKKVCLWFEYVGWCFGKKCDGLLCLYGMNVGEGYYGRWCCVFVYFVVL